MACGKEEEKVENKENASDISIAEEDHSDYIVPNNANEWNFPIIDDTQSEVDILDCVELGEYKGITIDDLVSSVSDAEVDERINEMIENTQIVNGTAKKGDSVYISYQGKMNNKELASVSSNGEQIIIGESNYTDDFDEALIGMTLDETKDVTIEFPPSYSNIPEIAGKKVEFHITLYTITRSYDELTDDWVHEYTNYSTVEEFKEGVFYGLQQDKEYAAKNDKSEAIWNLLMENSTIKMYKQTLVDKAATQYDTNVENNLAIAQISMDAYLKQMNMTYDEYKKQRVEDIRSSVAKEMIIEAIAEKEGFSKDDTDYQLYVETLAAEYQISVEALESLYMDGELEKQIMERRVMDLLEQNSTQE